MRAAGSLAGHAHGLRGPRSLSSAVRQVIRQYHGHLSGVYSLALNPDLSLVLTGEHPPPPPAPCRRDTAPRLWPAGVKLAAQG